MLCVLLAPLVDCSKLARTEDSVADVVEGLHRPGGCRLEGCAPDFVLLGCGGLEANALGGGLKCDGVGRGVYLDLGMLHAE